MEVVGRVIFLGSDENVDVIRDRCWWGGEVIKIQKVQIGKGYGSYVKEFVVYFVDDEKLVGFLSK